MATARTLPMLMVLLGLMYTYTSSSVIQLGKRGTTQADRGEGTYTLSFDDRNAVFEDWAEQFSHVHGDDWDAASRYAIFTETLDQIEKHNTLYHTGNSTFYMGLNQFSAMTHEEYRQYNNLVQDSSRDIHINSSHVQYNEMYFESKDAEPASVDWTAAGYVTPVKNQYQCGDCWIFSAIGALEGAYYKTHKRLVSFSEQQVLDCCTLTQCDRTCAQAGYSESVYQYVNAAHGLETEQEYPYTGQKSATCHFDHSKATGTVTSVTRVAPQGSDAALKTASAHVGPISVTIDASHPEFQHYSGGVMDIPNCSTTKTDHVVLLTGYGTAANNVAYWTIKNSWGTGWGLKGYGHMSRNKGSQCAIATYANYPTFQ